MKKLDENKICLYLRRMKSQSYPKSFLTEIEKALRIQSDQGQKPIAAFDADGTLWNIDMGETFFNSQIEAKQVPLPVDPWHYYLELKKVNNDPRSAYLWLAQINAGVDLERVRSWAEKAVQATEPLPIFAGQRDLVELLLKYQVEVFVVTASISWAVEPAAKRLGIKASNVLGVETLVENGIITQKGKLPVTYKQGKVDALLARTGGQRPFLASGNTSGDIALLDSATHFSIAINSVSASDRIFNSEQELKDYAEAKKWPYFFWG